MYFYKMHDDVLESLSIALLWYRVQKLEFYLIRASGPLKIGFYRFFYILYNSVKNVTLKKIVFVVDSLIDAVSRSV